MLHRVMGQQHLVDEMRQCGQVFGRDFQVIVHFPGQGKCFKDFGQIGQKTGKPFGIVAVMGGKGHRNHHQQPQTHLLTVDIGTISANDLVFFKPGTTARTLRRRQPDPF
eukprot:NODE_8030_length_568_cov_1.530612_g8007_i0.p2 GENE.NODE_8030_length_568_cov_1.530612_g8007_i0~~NODE_8030_length_568_cov_1.530612_g8007_i0.p2  ORF type:complete len:109 (+),score=13.08 NODE_8030_length_568_cov_1.530612_g8007_i0:132-458(+)